MNEANVADPASLGNDLRTTSHVTVSGICLDTGRSDPGRMASRPCRVASDTPLGRLFAVPHLSLGGPS